MSVLRCILVRISVLFLEQWGLFFGSECDRYWGINDVQSDSLVRMIFYKQKRLPFQTAFRKKIKTINNKLIVELSLRISPNE